MKYVLSHSSQVAAGRSVISGSAGIDGREHHAAAGRMQADNVSAGRTVGCPSTTSLFWGKQEMVGVERFELPTLWSQTRCATSLRYTPNGLLPIHFGVAWQVQKTIGLAASCIAQ
jgi:hypothetical protein